MSLINMKNVQFDTTGFVSLAARPLTGFISSLLTDFWRSGGYVKKKFMAADEGRKFVNLDMLPA